LSNKLSVEENSIADELATEGYANNTWGFYFPA
jgi:hypothetical protein